MKQGQASKSGPASQKVEPKSHAILPGGVAQIGEHVGKNPLHMDQGRGYESPKGGSEIHKSGSQGRHK